MRSKVRDYVEALDPETLIQVFEQDEDAFAWLGWAVEQIEEERASNDAQKKKIRPRPQEALTAQEDPRRKKFPQRVLNETVPKVNLDADEEDSFVPLMTIFEPLTLNPDNDEDWLMEPMTIFEPLTTIDLDDDEDW